MMAHVVKGKCIDIMCPGDCGEPGHISPAARIADLEKQLTEQTKRAETAEADRAMFERSWRDGLALLAERTPLLESAEKRVDELTMACQRAGQSSCIVAGTPVERVPEMLAARATDLQSMLNAVKATELQLDARIKELTAERDAARRATRHVPPTVHACGRKLECGGNCVNGAGHNGPCLCIGDVDGVPGTCPA